MENVRSSNNDRPLVEEQGLLQKNQEDTEYLSTGEASEDKCFPNFDVVTDYSDHMFRDSEIAIIDGSSTYKEIMKEWKILNENLPTSIYVRIYESRIDLLRAVIVGVPGTPYHDGLFFFDIMFPDCYPTKPPKVHYRSYGLWMSEIFSLSGSVCLSLLWNIPNKKDTANWIPGKSTIFQLLISLQALVLNEKPQYSIGEDQKIIPDHNKATNKWTKKMKWSMAYNRRVFESSCQLMVSCLRSPPKNFEEFVTQHFIDRSRYILSACVAYMNGYERVGGYRDHGSFSKEIVPVLASLQGCMATTYVNLVVAFCKINPSLGEFLAQLHHMAEDRMVREKTWLQKVLKMLLKIICVKQHVDETRVIPTYSS